MNHLSDNYVDKHRLRPTRDSQQYLKKINHHLYLRIANITWSKFVARLHRLYEQKKTDDNVGSVLGEYVQQWQRWVKAGLPSRIELTENHWPIKTPQQGGVQCDDIERVLRLSFASGNTD